jgi:hypothetical protein
MVDNHITTAPEPEKSAPLRAKKSNSGQEPKPETANAPEPTPEPVSDEKPTLHVVPGNVAEFKSADDKKTKASPYKPPADAADMADLFIDTGQGDPLTEQNVHGVTVDKPKDFYRTHPDPTYRRRAHVYILKIEGQVEEHAYIVAEAMRDSVPEAKLCLITTCVYRNGSVRLWLLKLPKEGEKDQMAWSTARSAAREALTQWTKLVWVGSKYETRSAQLGYAPDPDWTKVPPFERLVELGFGAHGVIRDESHPVYREHILGAAKRPSDDDLAL